MSDATRGECASGPPLECCRNGVERAIKTRRVALFDFRSEWRTNDQTLSGVTRADAVLDGYLARAWLGVARHAAPADSNALFASQGDDWV